ncbi:MAG: nuclear transport factor 2 family protein [Acidimicrobiia bacterium]
MSNSQLIERLYHGLRNLDGDAMAGCYAADSRFEDPAFGVLTGEEIGGMWRMLTSRSDGIEVDLSDVHANESAGSASWVASYTFGPKQRLVVNRATARFVFTDGLIASHVDTFSFHAWAKQALGPIGFVLGGTPILRNRVRADARRSLDRFLAPSEGEADGPSL